MVEVSAWQVSDVSCRARPFYSMNPSPSMPMPPEMTGAMPPDAPAPPAASDSGGMPTITLPGGYTPEDGKGPGDTVQFLGTMKLGPDGTTGTIMSVDGAKYAEPETPDEDAGESSEEPGDTSSPPSAPPMTFRQKALGMTS